MKVLYYFVRYLLIMLLGDLVKHVGIPSIFSLPYYCVVAYNFLAIQWGIKRQLEKDKNVKYQNIKWPIIGLTTLFNTLFFFLLHETIITWLILLISNFLFLFFLKPKREKIIDQTKKNIDDYFHQKDNND